MLPRSARARRLLAEPPTTPSRLVPDEPAHTAERGKRSGYRRDADGQHALTVLLAAAFVLVRLKQPSLVYGEPREGRLRHATLSSPT